VLTSSSVIAAAPTAVAEEAGEDAFAYDTATGRYYSLGVVGWFIWGQLDGHRPLSSVVDRLVSEFDVVRDDACQDALRFVDQLLAARLAHEVHPRDAG